MFEQALEKLGLATPFVYAAGIYYFFHYLDGQASAQAKTAISGWFKPLEYDRTAVAAAVVEIFDRLYTRPLLGWRAALRSALFTIVVTAIFAYEILSVQYVEPPPWQSLAGLLLTNIASDYVSLFIVRWLLVVGGKRPTVALLVGPLAGMFVVLLFALLREVGLFAFWATPDVVAGVAEFAHLVERYFLLAHLGGSPVAAAVRVRAALRDRAEVFAAGDRWRAVVPGTGR